MSRAPLVPFALSFLAGICCVVAGVTWWAPAALGVAALLWKAVVQVRGVSAVFGLALGIADAAFLAAPIPVADGHIHRFPATVDDVQAAPDGLVATTVRFMDGSSGTADLAPPAEPVGERIVLRGKRLPFDGPRNVGEPSPRDLAAERGLSWRVVRARILSRAPPRAFDVALVLPRLRAWASARLHERFPEPEATILAGAMWGERGSLPPDLRDEFQDTGTVHVLVTAGLHLGVVAAAVVALLTVLRCGCIGASLGAIPIVWFYAALSGDHLPSVRAATMLTFALVARAAGRETFSWNALAAAAIVVAALRPSSVSGVSFALSFTCVAAIFAFAPALTAALERIGAPALVREALGVAVATQIGTWPLTAYAFLVIAPYAPIANALVVPVVGVAMLGGFLTLALAPVPPLATVAAAVETSLVDWIVRVVRFVAALPGAHAVATPPPVWTIVVYDLALLAAGIALARAHVRRALAVIVCASVLCLWPPRSREQHLVVTVIDVGQADAILIRTPRGHAYLVDAGGRLEHGTQLGGDARAQAVGERIVVPFLVRQGIHHLDAALLSHPHGDHAGGLRPVLRTLGANGFADSGQSYAGHAYLDALAVVRERNIPLLEPRGGDVWHTDDGVTFRFYGPTLPYITGSRSDINSNSLVFRLEYGSFRMLFTGDAGSETEARLLSNGDDLRADVLKVGHHGSAYGTTAAFVRAVAPRIAIVSVGRDNLFGHPSPLTIATLAAAGTLTFRTDLQGAVTVTSDGTRFAATPFLAPESAGAPAITP